MATVFRSDNTMTRAMILSVLRGDSSNTDCLPFVREWRLCAELDLWLVSSEAAPAVTEWSFLVYSIRAANYR